MVVDLRGLVTWRGAVGPIEIRRGVLFLTGIAFPRESLAGLDHAVASAQRARGAPIDLPNIR